MAATPDSPEARALKKVVEIVKIEQEIDEIKEQIIELRTRLFFMRRKRAMRVSEHNSILEEAQAAQAAEVGLHLEVATSSSSGASTDSSGYQNQPRFLRPAPPSTPPPAALYRLQHADHEEPEEAHEEVEEEEAQEPEEAQDEEPADAGTEEPAEPPRRRTRMS